MSFPWFLAIASDDPVMRLQSIGLEYSEVVSFESGRPWLIANPLLGKCLFAQDGPRRLAVIGEFAADSCRLGSLLKAHQDPATVMQEVHGLPGSFFILLTNGRETWAQGTASGIRQLFLTRYSQTTLFISDSPSLLSGLTAARANLERVAWGLAHPGFDQGILPGSYWTGVDKLRGDERLHASDQTISKSVWWRSPEADLTIDQGAPLLETALRNAVSTRIHMGTRLSADLSGGLDSTSIALLLVSAGANFDAYVERTIDPNHDDYRWAQRAADEMGVHLHVFEPGDLPNPYDDIADPKGNLVGPTTYGLDAPYALIRNRARKAALARAVRSRGSTVHLAGFGGDELFTVAPSYLVDTFRHSPLRAIREARTAVSLRRWRWLDVLRTLLASQSYPEWLEEQFRGLDQSIGEKGRVTSMAWGPRIRMSRWATPSSIDMVRDVGSGVASGASPHADERATHTAIGGLRLGGERLGPLSDWMGAQGVQLSVPLMDDAVIEAACRIRKSEAVPGVAYKPVLKAAMRRVSNSAVYERATKGEFSMSVHRGIDANREALVAFFSHSHLEELGLIDGHQIRAAIRDGMRSADDAASLEATVGAEAWLRALDASGRTWTI